MTRTIRPKRHVRRTPGLLAAALALALTTSGGCGNAKQGAVSGAGIGALSGLAIGSLSGNAGKGAAIGAVVGVVGGAVIGDQNERRAEEAAAAKSPPPPAASRDTVYVTPQPTVIVTQEPGVMVAQPPYSTGLALGRLVGKWRISGRIDAGTGMLPVVGTARGSIDKTYFVRLDCNLTDPRTGMAVQGTSIISQTGGRGVQMNNAFSTSPEMRLFKGEMDSTGTLITLKQFQPPLGSRQIVIRMSAGRDWTAEVWDGGRRVESFTFAPTGA